VKNLTGNYLAHPEVIWIFLLLFLFFMFAIPLYHLFLVKRKRIKFERLRDTHFSDLPKLQDEVSSCDFCGSNRYKNELVIEVPLRAKFGLFFIKEYGYCRLMQARCGKCNTRLFCFVEESE